MLKHPLVWAQINIDAITHNIIALKKIINPNSKFMAVVKADAYGHGALKVAPKAIETGACFLGVARFSEGYKLRKSGINAPILIFGFTHPIDAEKLFYFDLTASVYNFEMAEQLSKYACQKKIKIKTHIKIDTGMGRVGMLCGLEKGCSLFNEKAVFEVKKILKLKGLDIKGIYTHFATADSIDKSYSQYQINVFTCFLNSLKKEKIEFEICHAANSAAIINFPESHFDMVRAGISMYGLYTSPSIDRSKVNLKPAMELKSIITSTKKVPKGFKISYDMTYETNKKTIIASVPIGYADGFSRALSSKGFMLVKGIKAPILGRICMDQTIIDVGNIPEIKTGDEVVIMGNQKDKTITADDIAFAANTINYDVVSSLTSRVAKLY
ncbi:MAG: alanine racemase [Desulfobacteraceae bacterium 4572_130]|nr:MAG: alanine racemase [Desulfobacteraceae bacterium 4572_130]